MKRALESFYIGLSIRSGYDTDNISTESNEQMSEDNTKDLTPAETLNLILNRLAGIEGGISAVESAAEDRAKETRPKLDLIIKELAGLREEIGEVKKELRLMNRKFEVFNAEMLEMKITIRDFDARLVEIERKSN
jgi:hypothetical protein